MVALLTDDWVHKHLFSADEEGRRSSQERVSRGDQRGVGLIFATPYFFKETHLAPKCQGFAKMRSFSNLSIPSLLNITVTTVLLFEHP